jgi:hypothetical protein
MALVDLSSDLSKFRVNVKTSVETRPDVSKAKSARSFGAFQPISEKLSSFAPKITKPTQDKLENKLESTSLDNIIKKLSNDLIINSVSRYSPVNISDKRLKLTQPSIEDISSKFQEIRQEGFTTKLNKSDILILRSERGTNNTTSPIEVNMLLAKTIDRKNSSPNVFSFKNTDNKELSSPNIFVDKNDSSDDVVNPDTKINTIPLTFDRTSSSPDILPSSNVMDKSGQSPDVLTPTLSMDVSGQSPDVLKSSPVMDKTDQSPDVFSRGESSDKSKSSPKIKTDSQEYLNNITDPKTKVFSKPLSFDKSGQSVLVNKDLISPLNNVVNPDIALEKSVLTFDKSLQSPEIFTETLKQGLVVNPNTKVFRIESGTNHLTDESKLNPDGIPFRFETTSRLEKRNPSRIVDDKNKYTGTSNQLEDNSSLNVDGVNRTNPIGRNENPEKSILSTKGTQEVNFFRNDNGRGFTSKVQKGVSEYNNNSEFVWRGSRLNAPETNFISDTNGIGFTKFAVIGDTKFKNETSKYGFEGKPSVNYFDLGERYTTDGFSTSVFSLNSFYKKDSSIFDWDGSRQNASTFGRFTKFVTPLVTSYVNDSSVFTWKGLNQKAPEVNFLDGTGTNTTKGFHTFAQQYDSKYNHESSRYGWLGNGSTAPQTNFFDVNKTNLQSGFDRFVTFLSTKYKNNTSKYGWVGSNTQAPSTNFFTNTSATGFTTFSTKLSTEYKAENSEFVFKGVVPNPTDFFSNTNSSGFTTKITHLNSQFSKDSSVYTFKGNSRQAPTVNFIQDTSNGGFTSFAQSLTSEFKKDISKFGFKGSSRQAPTVNFIQDSINSGFTSFVQSQVTEFKKDISRFSFAGTSRQASGVNYISDTINTGFTTFAQSQVTEFKTDVSRYSFVGGRTVSPQTNFFSDTPSSGFDRLARYLDTKYVPKVSKFTWNGDRQNAPEVNFFYIPGKNPNAIPGFNKLFVDKSETKLSDSYSGLSFAGTTVRSAVKPVPYTNFFGYIPSERSGFMVNMSTFDGTLYPNVSPKLNYNADSGTRIGVEKLRALRGGLKTTKSEDEKYAPKSLGPRPWIDGTLVSTLDSQIPEGQIKTGANAGSYLKKYETALREGTNGLGFVTKWATTRRSPSPLDEQYLKYKLQNESTNSEPAFFFQPYVVRGIQRDGEVENQRWGFGVTFDDGLVRGGAVTQTERILADTIRLGKWTASVKGLLFNIKQVGLQLMNPNVDINPSKTESSFLGVSATQIFNPLSIIANIASARIGLHLPRHGILPFNKDYLNRYEDATIARENKSKFIDPNYKKFDDLETPTVVDRQKDYNRLIGLMKELLPNSFKPVVAADVSSDFTTSALARAGIELAKKLTGQTGIARLSSTFGGPQSILGIGGTQINRASHPYLTSYTTTPLLMLTGEQKEPQYQASAKRNSYYAAMATYKESFNLTNMLRTIAYNLPSGPFEINDENVTRNVKNITNLQPSTVNRITKQNPFDPKYDLFDNRLQATNENNIQRAESLAKGINPVHANPSNPLLLYRTATYDKLGVTRDRRRSKNSTTSTGDMNDFRADLDLDNPQLESFITDPAVVDYANNNLEDRFGFGKHGKVGVKRNKPFANTISYAKAKEGHSIPRLKDADNEFRGDRINIIDYKRGKFEVSKELVYEVGGYNNRNLPGAEDLIEFYFTGLTINGTQSKPAEVIVFRSTFGSISDSHNADWSTIKYMGRADPLYVYQGYDRDITFDFVVQITSRDEMKATWRKINNLASWTAPEYTKGGFMKAPIIRLNIGNLYRKMPGFMTSIRYNFDNAETTWETAKLKDDRNLLGQTGDQSSPGVLQLPKTIRVECSFTPIGVYRPEYNGVMYSLFDDSAAGKLENGLIPNDDIRVNYFKTFDVDETGNKQNFDTQENTRFYNIPPGTESTIPQIKEEERDGISGKQESQDSQTVPSTRPTVPADFQGPATDTTTYRNPPGDNLSSYQNVDR